MTDYICRDYAAVTTGYTTNAFHTSYLYLMSIFMYRVMGFSYVGSTGFNLDDPLQTLTVTGATSTNPVLYTTSTPHGFSNDDSHSVGITGITGNTNANGTYSISVVDANTFTAKHSNFNATYAGGGTVTSGFLLGSGLVADGYGAGINFGASVEKNVSIPIQKRKVVVGDVGRILVLKSNKFPTKNAGLFKVTAINQGNNTTIALASSGTTTIAAASNGQSLPQATINVASTTNFPTSGTIFVTTNAGVQTVTYTGKGATTFTGCTGGTGTMSTGGTVTNTAATLPQSTITVASTTGFPASGTLYITLATDGTQIVNYTGTTATTFTGCTGGTGIMTVGDTVANLNRYVIDYRSTENPPAEADNSMDWWLYEIENTAGNRLRSHSYNNSVSLSVATNASPIEIDSGTQFWSTGDIITISGGLGNTAVNGTWTITQVPTTSAGTRFRLNGSVGNGTYTGGATAYLENYITDGYTGSTSRIILQSPHSSGWQVRLAIEPYFSGNPVVSITTGFGGNSRGDFPPGAPQTHVAEYFDTNIAKTGKYYLTTPGIGSLNTAISRITMMGDGYGKSICTITRATDGNSIISFGIPDNEPNPLPIDSERIYSYGATNDAQSFNYKPGVIGLRPGGALNTGTAFKQYPRLCMLTGWANIDGTSLTNPMFSVNAADSPFTSTTEVLPIEVWAGTLGDIGLTTGLNPPFFFDPTYMGTAPYLRVGRSNFGTFTLSTEEVTTRSVIAASNTTPIQITTSVANALTTGQTVTISGVVGNTAANGTFTITVINNQNFTLDNSVGNGTYSSGGTINGTPRWQHLQNGIYLQWNGCAGLTP